MKTNSKFKLGTAKARRIYLVVALALFLLLATEKVFAQEVATGVLSQTGTGLTTFNLPPGNSVFQLDLNITTNFNSLGITYFLVSNDGSGLICITGRQTFGSPFCGNQPEPASVINPPPPPPDCLDPVNDNDLGCTIPNLFQPAPPGKYFISRLTLTVTGAVAGQTYHIVRDQRDIIADANFADVSVALNTVTIHIVPGGSLRQPH